MSLARDDDAATEFVSGTEAGGHRATSAPRAATKLPGHLRGCPAGLTILLMVFVTTWATGLRPGCAVSSLPVPTE